MLSYLELHWLIFICYPQRFTIRMSSHWHVTSTLHWTFVVAIWFVHAIHCPWTCGSCFEFQSSHASKSRKWCRKSFGAEHKFISYHCKAERMSVRRRDIERVKHIQREERDGWYLSGPKAVEKYHFYNYKVTRQRLRISSSVCCCCFFQFAFSSWIVCCGCSKLWSRVMFWWGHKCTTCQLSMLTKSIHLQDGTSLGQKRSKLKRTACKPAFLAPRTSVCDIDTSSVEVSSDHPNLALILQASKYHL